MTIEETIQKAIEGGYNKGYKLQHFGAMGDILFVKGVRSKAVILEEILLDPLFWQSLGKAMGWGSGCNICLKDQASYASDWADECKNPKSHLTKNHKYPWQVEWHRFVDHLSEGKDIESFFNQF